MSALQVSIVKLAALVLVGLAALTLTSASSRADERDEENRRDRMRQRERWAEADNAPSADGDRYAAIAYSATTRRYGYAWDYDSLAKAQRVAVAGCKAADARPVTWAKNGWYCALAQGADGSYGSGSGPTAASARMAALSECRKHNNDCRVVVCIR
jgi:hypothetical protein